MTFNTLEMDARGLAQATKSLDFPPNSKVIILSMDARGLAQATKNLDFPSNPKVRILKMDTRRLAQLAKSLPGTGYKGQGSGYRVFVVVGGYIAIPPKLVHFLDSVPKHVRNSQVNNDLGGAADG